MTIRLIGPETGETISATVTQGTESDSLTLSAYNTEADITVTVSEDPVGHTPKRVNLQITGWSGFTTTAGSFAGYDARLSEILYFTEWGDDGAVYSAPTQLPAEWMKRNVSYGPLVSHVYRTPGTYTIRMWAFEPSTGREAYFEHTHTVISADVAFDGDTVFVTNSGATAPVGAIATYADFASAYAARNTNTRTRILFHDGDTFNDFPQTDVSIGLAGVESLLIGVDSPTGVVNLNLEAGIAHGFRSYSGASGLGAASRLTYEGIRITGGWDDVTETGDGDQSAWVDFSGQVRIHNLLYDRCEALNCEFGMSDTGNDDGPEFRTTFHDCIVEGWQDCGIFMGAVATSDIMGCRLRRSDNASNGGPKGGPPFYNNHGCIRLNASDLNRTYVDGLEGFPNAGWSQFQVDGYSVCQPILRANQEGAVGSILNLTRMVMEGGNNLISLSRQNANVGTSSAIHTAIIDKVYAFGTHQAKYLVGTDTGGLTIRDTVIVFPDLASLDRPGGGIDGAFRVRGLVETFTPHNQPTGVDVPCVLDGVVMNNLLTDALSPTGDAEVEWFTNGGSYTDITIKPNCILTQPGAANYTDIADYSGLTETAVFTTRTQGYKDTAHGNTALLPEFGSPPDGMRESAIQIGDALANTVSGARAKPFTDILGHRRGATTAPGAHNPVRGYSAPAALAGPAACSDVGFGLVDNADGTFTINVTTLPSAGDSAITAVQYSNDGTTWRSLPTPQTGSYSIDTLSDGTAVAVGNVDVQMRVHTQVGAGGASSVQTVAVTSGVAGTNVEILATHKITTSAAAFAGDRYDPGVTMTFIGPSSQTITIDPRWIGPQDGDFEWNVYFDEVGAWTYSTPAGATVLHGLSGNINVTANPAARGPTVATNGFWGVQRGDGTITGVAPAQMMAKTKNESFQACVSDAAAQAAGYVDLQDAVTQIYTIPAKADGFNGVHIMSIGNRWFDIASTTAVNGSVIGAGPYDPDPQMFTAMQNIIRICQSEDILVHFWCWGDNQRGQTPDQFGGENSAEHQKFMRYLVASLAGVPGWTVGYGFDNYEWSTPGEVETRLNYMKGLTSLPMRITARGPDDAIETASDWFDGPLQDFVSLELRYKDTGDAAHVQLDRALTEYAAPDTLLHSGDRQRHESLDGSSNDTKDITLAEFPYYLHLHTLYQGMSWIPGNLLTDTNGSVDPYDGSFPLPTTQRQQMLAGRTFWDNFFIASGARRPSIANNEVAAWDFGPYVIAMFPNTQNVDLNLSGLVSDGDWTRVNIQAFDIRSATYALTDIGVSNLVNRTADLGSSSDWLVVMTNTTDAATLSDPATGGAQPTILEVGSTALLLGSGGETYTYAATPPAGSVTYVFRGNDNPFDAGSVPTDFTKYWYAGDLGVSLTSRLQIDRRVNDGTEVSFFIPNNENDASSNKVTPVVVIVIDRDVVEDVAVSHVIELGDATTFSFNSITTTTDNTLVFAVAVLDDRPNAVVATWPAELVPAQRIERDTLGGFSNNSATLALGWIEQSTAGPVSVGDITFDLADGGITAVFAVREA